ncbi:MAG: hypothetical protein L6R42_004740, partial [Xanthoria sp. 1 TBL-2021]
MMTVWSQLSARALEYILPYFQLAKAADTHNITKFVKIITTEKAISGHNITAIASCVPMEEVFTPIRTSFPAASKTTLSSQSPRTSFDIPASIASFDLFTFGSFLCLICFLAVIGLCLGFSRYHGLLSPVRLPLRQHPFLPLLPNTGNDDRALKWVAAKTPRVLKSQLCTFIGGMAVCHVGNRVFDPVKDNDDGIYTYLTKGTWDMLACLFYLLRKCGDVVQEWLHPFEQTMLEALLVLKTHWLLTLLIAGMLGLATAAVARWRSMDWQARQVIWFKFLSVCICLWALLAELRDWCTHMLIDFGCWCCTQDFRGFMMNIAMFGVEVNLLFFRGLNESHHQIRESQKQKMIDKMAVVHKAKCDVHDREMKEKNSHIEEQETQITSLNEEIGTTAEERNKYKKLYEETYWSKFITERQCKNTVTYIRQEAQREVSISATRWASSFQARGNLANTLLDQRLQHSTYVGQATQQITELGTQLEQARAPCEEHTSKINELQGDNTALRAQLKAKDEIIEAKPKLPEISTAHIGLAQIPQDVCETVYQHLLASGWAQILEQHTQLTNERPSLMEEGLGLFTRCNNLEAQVKEFQSGSSTQQDSSGKLQDLQVR